MGNQAAGVELFCDNLSQELVNQKELGHQLYTNTKSYLMYAILAIFEFYYSLNLIFIIKELSD